MRKRFALGSVIVIVAAATIGGGVSPAGATYPGPNGRLAFTHCERAIGGCQIFTSNPDGSSLDQVTTEGESFLPDWSPDGTKIAYAGTASGDAAIWVADADGSNARQLTPNDRSSDDFWPRFHPDGDRILYVNCLGSDCDGGLYSVRLDGTHRHAVTPNSGASYNVGEISPNRHRLAYMRWHVDGVKMGIYVARPDGSRERLITPPRLEAWYPDWSPSGENILFSDRIFFDRPNLSIYTIHPDGSGLNELTDNAFRINDWGAAYSPDGRKIVFNSDRRAGCYGCGDLFIMTADGAHTWMVHLPFDAYDVRWGSAPLSSAPSEPTVATRVVPTAPFQPWRDLAGFTRG